jgi:hypothetical protein
MKLDMLLLGKKFPEVHKWLDATFNDSQKRAKYGRFGQVYYHWVDGHHEETLRTKFGDTPEFQAGRLHMIADWLSHWNIAEFPKNGAEVKKLLDAKLDRFNA